MRNAVALVANLCRHSWVFDIAADYMETFERKVEGQTAFPSADFQRRGSLRDLRKYLVPRSERDAPVLYVPAYYVLES